MATILPGSPPAFNKNDVEGTVKALCAYTRNMHETMDFLLGQIEKDMTKLKDSMEEQGKTIATLQTSLVSALEIMNEQYLELNERVSALEAGQT